MKTGMKSDNPAWFTTFVTAYPDMFPGFLGQSLSGRALSDGKWGYSCLNLRDFSDKPTGRIDDSPFGGGAGMVIEAPVVDRALSQLKDDGRQRILLSPRGEVFDQKIARQLAQSDGVVLICGRFEGIDERVTELHNLRELSLGDFVLSGGEVAALAIADACIRLQPLVMGSAESLGEESFNDYLLEYPQYTRPEEFRGLKVPSVLLSGNHAEIANWKRKKSEEITRTRRADLWEKFLATRPSKTK